MTIQQTAGTARTPARDFLAKRQAARSHFLAAHGHSQKDNIMTETTVPRVARFADLRVGMTVERVYTHASGSTDTRVGVVSEVTARTASDGAGFWLADVMDDDNPRATLRILCASLTR